MPLNKPIQFHGVENMVGRDMLALNLPQKEMEALCVKQLEAGDAIWFACDAGLMERGRKAFGILRAFAARPFGGFSNSYAQRQAPRV